MRKSTRKPDGNLFLVVLVSTYFVYCPPSAHMSKSRRRYRLLARYCPLDVIMEVLAGALAAVTPGAAPRRRPPRSTFPRGTVTADRFTGIPLHPRTRAAAATDTPSARPHRATRSAAGRSAGAGGEAPDASTRPLRFAGRRRCRKVKLDEALARAAATVHAVGGSRESTTEGPGGRMQVTPFEVFSRFGSPRRPSPAPPSTPPPLFPPAPPRASGQGAKSDGPLGEVVADQGDSPAAIDAIAEVWLVHDCRSSPWAGMTAPCSATPTSCSCCSARWSRRIHPDAPAARDARAGGVAAG